MYYEKERKAKPEEVVKFITDAAKLNNKAVENGFGLSGGTAANQDLAITLVATGDISVNTGKQIIKGTKKRNHICHDETPEELTSKEVELFSEATQEVFDVIKKHKTEGVLTRL